MGRARRIRPHQQYAFHSLVRILAYCLLNSLRVKITADGVGPILAAVSCNYRKQVKYPDTLVIGTKVTRIGHSSMTLEHVLWRNVQNAIVADGDSTVVMFDYDNQKSSPISDELKKRIEEVEGHPLK